MTATYPAVTATSFTVTATPSTIATVSTIDLKNLSSTFHNLYNQVIINLYILNVLLNVTLTKAKLYHF